MGTLHSQAEEVVIWLGVESVDSDLAFRALTPETKTISEKISKFSKNEWKAIHNIGNREYWTRIWIVQEIVRGRSPMIQCGYSRLPWQAFGAFFNAMKTWRRRWAFTIPVQHSIISMSSPPFRLNQQRNSSAQRSMLSLLEGTTHCRATDPRDMIYGILGLVRDRFTSDLSQGTLPDFGRFGSATNQRQWLIDYSISPRELYKNLMTYAAWFAGDFKGANLVTVRFSQLLLRFLWEGSREDQKTSGKTKDEENMKGVKIEAKGRCAKIQILSPSFQDNSSLEEMLDCWRSIYQDEIFSHSMRCG
jgi:hypothetical protein